MSALLSLSGGDADQRLIIPQENGNRAPPDARGRSPVSAREARASTSKLSKADRRVSSWGQSLPAFGNSRSGPSPAARRPSLNQSDLSFYDSLPPPPPMPGAVGPASRNSSPARSAAGSGTSSRPTTPHRQHPPPDYVGTFAATPKEEKKKSKGLFGKSKIQKRDENYGPVAWVIGHEGRLPYDVSHLINGAAVSYTTAEP